MARRNVLAAPSESEEREPDVFGQMQTFELSTKTYTLSGINTLHYVPRGISHKAEYFLPDVAAYLEEKDGAERAATVSEK